jgi:hypothetical protein
MNARARPSCLAVCVLALAAMATPPRAAVVRAYLSGVAAPPTAITAIAHAAESMRVSSAASLAPHAGTAREVLADPVHLREVRADGADDPAQAIDGDPATAWTGDAAAKSWAWTATFRAPVHLGLLRARWGVHTNLGVPTAYAWEIARPPPGAARCEDVDVDPGTARWAPLEDAHEDGARRVAPTHRSWFVHADACALRLRVLATNLGPPVLRELTAFESARDVLADATADAEGGDAGSDPAAAVDERYDRAFRGAPGRAWWGLTVHLREAVPIDRVTMTLGLDATSRPRAGGVGRTYGVAAGPQRWELEASADGEHFETVARSPTDRHGRPLPVRRPLVELAARTPIRALRLVMLGATDLDGKPSAAAFPVVRELAAYRADDDRPVLATPWILSVNANPSGQSHGSRGGELANDIYFAKFLQQRFASVLPALARDDRFSRALAPGGALREATRGDAAGEAIEAIEGDDPTLSPAFLAASWPRPLVVLSGANDWDFARAKDVGPDPHAPSHWRWDPLRFARDARETRDVSETRDASDGGMGQLAPAVQQRLAPFVGFCGGAQILALLEARRPGVEDGLAIDALVRRNDGRLVRGHAGTATLQRAWPGQPGPRDEIRFEPDEPLFADLAGPLRRQTTRELPEWHVDAIRPEAFRAGGPLARLKLVATSRFCTTPALALAGGAPSARHAAPKAARARAVSVALTGVEAAPAERCEVVPQAFRSTDDGWPIIGTQFHPEQYDFSSAALGDPPESVADAGIFVSALYEQLVDATLRLSL